jgi:hypothetical protein
MSSKTARSSAASTATRDSTAPSTVKKNARLNETTPVAGPSNTNVNGKRKHSPLEPINSDDLPTIGAIVEPPPRKKRKVEAESVVETDGSDREATPMAKVRQVEVEDNNKSNGKSVPGKGKRKAIQDEEDSDIDEEGAEAPPSKVLEVRKKPIAKKKEPPHDDLSNSGTSSRSKTPATKKAKTKPPVAANRRAGAVQRATPAGSSSDHESSHDPAPPVHTKKPLQPLFIAEDDDDDEPPPLQRRAPIPPSTLYQSHAPPTEERGLSPELQFPMSPPRRVSLSPAAEARLKEFDAWAEEDNNNTKPLPVGDVDLAEPDSHRDNEINMNQMYIEYVDFDPQAEPEPQVQPSTAPAPALNGSSKPPTLPASSPPPSSPPPLLAKGGKEPREPVNDQDEPPPLLKPKQIRVESGRFSKNNSFRLGIVPETETESSTNNTQSQSQPLPPVPQIIEPPITDVDVNTPSRASLIRRMRPRTPGSASGSKLSLIDEANTYDPLSHDYDDGNSVPPSRATSTNPIQNNAAASGKFLRPIPMLSPSKFVPHLPSSISNQATEVAEVEELMSSIEQFSSPENDGSGSGPHLKKKQRRDKGKGKEKTPDNEPQAQDTSITEDEDTVDWPVMDRGQKMAEAARQERLAREKDPSTQKISLLEILRATKDSAKRKESVRDKNQAFGHKNNPLASGYGSEGGRSKRKSRLEALEERRDGTPSAESRGQRTPELGAESAHEMDDADLDAEGEDETDIAAAIALREEEEESTQDLMADMELGVNEVDVEMAWDPAGHSDIPAGPNVQQEPELDPEQSAAASGDYEVKLLSPTSLPLSGQNIDKHYSRFLRQTPFTKRNFIPNQLQLLII